MASNAVDPAKACAVVTNEQSEVVIPGQALDTDEAVAARVPCKRLSIGRVERSELFALHDLVSKCLRALVGAEAKHGVGITRKWIV